MGDGMDVAEEEDEDEGTRNGTSSKCDHLNANGKAVQSSVQQISRIIYIKNPVCWLYFINY